MDSESENGDDVEMSEPKGSPDGQQAKQNSSQGEVYLPGKPLREGEELVCDESAYIILRDVQTGRYFSSS